MTTKAAYNERKTLQEGQIITCQEKVTALKSVVEKVDEFQENVCLGIICYRKLSAKDRT